MLRLASDLNLRKCLAGCETAPSRYNTEINSGEASDASDAGDTSGVGRLTRAVGRQQGCRTCPIGGFVDSSACYTFVRRRAALVCDVHGRARKAASSRIRYLALLLCVCSVPQSTLNEVSLVLMLHQLYQTARVGGQARPFLSKLGSTLCSGDGVGVLQFSHYQTWWT